MPAVWSKRAPLELMKRYTQLLHPQRYIKGYGTYNCWTTKAGGLSHSHVLRMLPGGRLTTPPLYFLRTKTDNQKENSSRSSPNKKSEDENQDTEPPTPPPLAQLFLSAIMMMFPILVLMSARNASQNDINDLGYIEWDRFVMDYLVKGEVERIIAAKGVEDVYVKLYPGAVVKGAQQDSNRSNRMNQQNLHLKLKIDPEQLEENLRKVEKEMGITSADSLQVEWRDFSNMQAFISFLAFLALGAMMISAFRILAASIKVSNPFETMSKASYTRGDLSGSSSPKIRFSDIAGMKEAKVEIKEYVEYLKNPSRFQNLGARIPRGALLLGPPGCGKTLLAKAVATESEVPFLVMAGTDFVEMIGGLGASRMRSLFKEARKLKPCIIYIDEIDALGRSRSGSAGQGGGESEHTLNQLLVEMDGMTDNSGVIMLASTNRADVLDKALLRPGRFDRHVNIELPTLIERKELFNMYLKKISLDKPITDFIDFLAQATPGMSGADIANVCNEAALNAARDGNKSVKESNLRYALDKILAGQAKTSNTVSQSERQTIAYHECGHVLVSWLLEHTDALLKVSVIPRTSAALGFAQYMPSDKKFHSKEDLFERMCVLLGGRAAENIVFNRITTGAQDDLDKVRELAYGQIKHYGMGDSVGLMAFPPGSGGDYQSKPYSKDLQQRMDMEAQQVIAKAYKTAEDLIRKNRSKLDKLCQLLLDKEEMSYDDVKAAIGPPLHGEKKIIDMG